MLTLIGATTENPSFEVIAALLSRCRVLRLKALDNDDIYTIIQRALADEERGLVDRKIEMEDEAMKYLASVAGGDARVALNTLEVTATTTQRGDDGIIRLSVEAVEAAMQHKAVTGTMMPYPRCTKAFVIPIPMGHYTGWRG